jgi:ribonuclease BN (tRNA processing enzyme)
VRLAFLGTGSAFSPNRLNGAVLVNGRYLLDAGAPVLVGLRQAGASLLDLRTIFITHFHGDHILGLPTLLAGLANWQEAGIEGPGGHRPRLQLIGPPGLEDTVNRLCELCWRGETWAFFLSRMDLDYLEVAPGDRHAFDEGAGHIEVFRMDHFGMDAVGFVLDVGGRRLGYSGDTAPCAGLDALVESSDVVIVEATSPSGASPGHMSRHQAAELARAYPDCRFFFNHILEADAAHIDGVVIPRDGEVLEVD